MSLEVGPFLHLKDAVGSKVTAMLGRGLPRDFIDVAAALRHYSREDLMRMAFARDPGLRVIDFTDAVWRLERFVPGDFAEYGFDPEAVNELRDRFADWPRGSRPGCPGAGRLPSRPGSREGWIGRVPSDGASTCLSPARPTACPTAGATFS